MKREDRLRFALGAVDLWRSQARLRRGLEREAWAVGSHLDGMASADRAALEAQVLELLGRGVDVCIRGDERYPVQLAHHREAPGLLFMWGNPELLSRASVGMCGSRRVSPKGLEAARACGLEVARQQLSIVSGYAKGVDTETHLAALESGGSTVIVLAEGILGFRWKRVFKPLNPTAERVLVLSQFAPNQRWNVGAAMSRNTVIAALGRALVVIEAGDTGGTVNAGLQALGMGRPVLALEFTDGTPLGNIRLFTQGAIPIRSKGQLGRVIHALRDPDSAPDTAQLSLL